MRRLLPRILIMLLICSNVACYGQTASCCCGNDTCQSVRRADSSSESVGTGLAGNDACLCDANHCTCDECGADPAIVAVYEYKSAVPEHLTQTESVNGGGTDLFMLARSLPLTKTLLLRCIAIEPLLQSCSFLS